MKFIISLALIAAFATPLFADQGKPGYGIGKFEQEQAYKRLIDSVVKKSGLEKDMLPDQPHDLANLKKALVKAIKKDSEAYDYFKNLNDVELPRLSRIKDKNIRDGEFFKIKLQLTFIAGENGYREKDQ